MQFLFRSPSMPTADTALPGRTERMPLTNRHYVNGAPLQGPWPEGTRTAIFGLGCFWGAEKDFWEIPGVVSTAVGYAGGYTPNPDYREVCTGRTGHAEVVLVAYDPGKVTYEQLLKVFWEAHDPTQGHRQGNDQGTQYRSVILTADADQQSAAEASRDAFQERLTAAGYGRITTEIAPVGPFRDAEDFDGDDRTRPDPPNSFYYAEDYHQQYLAKNVNGYCPNHATGVRFPDVAVTPLRFVD